MNPGDLVVAVGATRVRATIKTTSRQVFREMTDPQDWIQPGHPGIVLARYESVYHLIFVLTPTVVGWDITRLWNLEMKLE